MIVTSTVRIRTGNGNDQLYASVSYLIRFLVIYLLHSSKPGLRIRINFIRIRIQHFRLNTDPDPVPIRVQGFNDQKLKKITVENKKNILIKNYNLPIPRPP